MVRIATGRPAEAHLRGPAPAWRSPWCRARAFERGELELHAWVYTLELRVYNVATDHFVPASELLASGA